MRVIISVFPSTQKRLSFDEKVFIFLFIHLLKFNCLFFLASQYGITPEQEMKQRRTSYLIATDQRIPNRANYVPADFSRTNKNENYSYEGQQQQTAPPPQQQQQQKLR